MNWGLAFLLIPCLCMLPAPGAWGSAGRGYFWQDAELCGLCRVFPRDGSARQCQSKLCQWLDLLIGEMSCPCAPTPPGTLGAHQHQVLPVWAQADIFAG